MRAPITPDKVEVIYLPSKGDAITRLRLSTFFSSQPEETQKNVGRGAKGQGGGKESRALTDSKHHGTRRTRKARHIGNKNLTAALHVRTGQCYFMAR